MICLTFDTDHIDEERMREFLAGVEIPGRATFFCTEPYESIDASHEVCPHAELESQDWDAPLDEARRLFPDAKGFRAHGCLWSHGLALELSKRGYTYVSSHDQFGEPSIRARREAWGVWHLPIYYMDTLDISFARHWTGSDHRPFARELLDTAVAGDELYVFAFHPVHLMLNSVSVDDYLSRRDSFLAGEALEELRCEGYGAGEFYASLCELMVGEGAASVTLSDAVAVATGSN